jgi:hypothetical protein
VSLSKTSQKGIATTERQRKAVELRKAGCGYQEIADQLGYKDASGAYRAVRAALKAAVHEPAQELITLEATRLDDLLRGIWMDARKGNVAKIDRALRIMARRAEMLGLDAPKRAQIGGDPDNPAPLVVERVVFGDSNR